MPNNVVLLNLMYLFHVIDDFGLQGIMASMKQKDWWKKQEGYSDKYKDDWTMALFMHSLSWSIFITLPILWYFNFQVGVIWNWIIIVNALIHYWVDNLKANKKKINLIQDQTYHLLQIIITFAIAVAIKTTQGI